MRACIVSIFCPLTKAKKSNMWYLSITRCCISHFNHMTIFLEFQYMMPVIGIRRIFDHLMAPRISTLIFMILNLYPFCRLLRALNITDYLISTKHTNPHVPLRSSTFLSYMQLKEVLLPPISRLILLSHILTLAWDEVPQKYGLCGILYLVYASSEK